MNMKKIGVMMAIMAISVMIWLPSFAQGPERFVGNPLPGVIPHTIPGGINGPVAWDNGTEVLVGAVISGLLIYMIENNRYEDRNRHYSDSDRDRYRDWDRDRDGDWSRDRDRDRRRDGAWDNRNDRHTWGYNDRPRRTYRPNGW